MNSFFITGTDTGVGKTRTTLALMTALKLRGLRVAGMKPVATGCAPSPSGLRNQDAEMIRACCGEEIPYELINPYAFEPPVAPLFAARAFRTLIEKTVIERAFTDLSNRADTVMVEGVGGWRIRLGEGLQMSDLVQSMQLRVILVVGLRLGCINHALLSAAAIRDDGLRLAGWIANHIDPGYDRIGETVQLLSEEIQAPMIGLTPFSVKYDSTATAAHLFPAGIDVLTGSN